MSTTVRPAPADSAPPVERRKRAFERNAWFYINIALVLVAFLVVATLLYSLINPAPLYGFWRGTFQHDLPFDIPYFRSYFELPQVWRAIRVTFILAILAQSAGVILGLLAALARTSRIALLRVLARLYIWIWRGTPVFLQLVMIAYGVPILLESMDPSGKGLISSFALLMGSNALAAGFVGLSLNEGAYMSEIVRAGIEAIDRGQMEAAKALGMTYGLAMRRIVLPQALKVIIPPTGNEFISMLKTTSLVAYIGAQELTLVTLQIYAHNFKVLESLTGAGIYYLAMTTVLTFVQMQIERRIGERRAEIRPHAIDNLRRLFLGSAELRHAVPAGLPPKEAR
jgi:polar amino acid transport system permease protein